MKIPRRQFIKQGALYVPLFNILVPKAKAQLNVTSPFFTAGLLKPAAGGGSASFTFGAKASNVSAGFSATSTVQLTGVSSGDLIVVAQKSEGSGEGPVTGISDGTSALSLATETEHANGDLRWIYGYLLSSVATGSVTYTVTRSSAFSCCYTTFAMRFSYTGTPTFDAENGASGTSTSVNSGQITTGASVSVVFGSYAHYSGATLSAMQIGGSNADGSEPTTPGASQSAMWYRILSSVMTNGAATGTLDGSNEWVSRILSIKAT